MAPVFAFRVFLPSTTPYVIVRRTMELVFQRQPSKFISHDATMSTPLRRALAAMPYALYAASDVYNTSLASTT